MPEPSTSPTALPGEIVDSLDGCSPAQLRQVARNAENFATYRDKGSAETAVELKVDNRPDEAPAKATITVKEINNRYYYWQWQDGEHVSSAYKGPVNPGD
ncbi:hypothetical protein [Halobacterium sp. KA-6]|uniref:hypothetical protein n=1 Tax=Halobacterium sp. KA-6 TaxID=2896368 RepID=UPI001E294552|nr:hypothetical protein [Halobacterium sp. KA-6]MCD2201861.1 hypothetical protein [Halobacterium sp. KA-6]